jgi:hypothetical protein
MAGAGDKWTEEQIDKLKQLIAAGASPTRAAAALGRKILAVKIKANELGTPFPSVREVRAKLREIFASNPSNPVR